MDRYRVFVQTKISADGGWVPYIDAQRAIEEVHQQYGGRASEYEARIAELERERDEVRARAENLPPGSTESDDRDPGASGCTGERK